MSHITTTSAAASMMTLSALVYKGVTKRQNNSLKIAPQPCHVGEAVSLVTIYCFY